jgi:peptidyl-prolyl cis-trans isomerase SurA
VQKRTDTGDYLFERFTEKLLLEHEESLLPQKYPEYRYLLQEYQEGTLLFSIMQDSIWSRAATDSAGLAQFFAQNSERYQWPERAEATVLSMATPALQQQAATALTAGYLTTDTFSYTTIDMSAADVQELFGVWLAEVTAAETPRYAEQLNVVFTYHKKADEQLLQALQQQLKDSLQKLPVSITTNMVRKYRKKQLEVQLFTRQLSPANIAAWYNRSQPLSATAATEIFTAETLPQGVQWQKGVQQAQQNGRYLAVRINELLAAGPQQLTEVRGLVVSQYQQHLEQQWLQQLNKRFKVVVDEPVFAELLAELTR